MINDQVALHPAEIKEIIEDATRVIAPLWSLENFVAVNPYMGLSNMEFNDAMDVLNKSGKIHPTLPISFYLQAIDRGKLLREDIEKAFESNHHFREQGIDAFIQQLPLVDERNGATHIQTVAEVASKMNNKRWHRFMIDRISFWASAYFDDKQAIWDTANARIPLFAAWKKEAEIDLAAEMMGLKGFRKQVRRLPNDHFKAITYVLEKLNLPADMIKYYLVSLLLKMNGWAGFAARIDWEARLKGKESHALEEFLAVMLSWEVCIKESLHHQEMDDAWVQSKREMQGIAGQGMNQVLAIRLVLQEAFDIANQRTIIEKINNQPPYSVKNRKTDVQAVFCIDVRSEVFRRNLEAVHNGVETLGFAGFFAFPIKYVPLAHEEGLNQCPVLLTPTHIIKEGLNDPKDEKKVTTRRSHLAMTENAWKSFKKGAISCFGFVSPLGLFFLPKLLSDALGLSRPVTAPDNHGLSDKQIVNKGIRLDQEHWKDEITGISIEDRIRLAASALKAMSLTEDFASIVLIVGHGASTVNNPHATGLDCGACGGHSGESNAKVAAAVLNDIEVREALKKEGIEIPLETVFVAGLHDTTTDHVRLFHQAELPTRHLHLMDKLKYALKMAGEASRKERAIRMQIIEGDIDKQVLKRSKDWSQVRPEWGLAGCSSFIVAPRIRTAHLNFGAKAFMHDYLWKKDKEFSVLELIMTAPMVVASWINLQYYASTVDNKRFGSGNKTLHNVVGAMGVLEGFGGDLRVGLPWQSIHDGDSYQHEPNRLNVIIEAPVDEISKILRKHDSIRQLCDNEWIYLFAMNDQGKVEYKYEGNLEWSFTSPTHVKSRELIAV